MRGPKIANNRPLYLPISSRGGAGPPLPTYVSCRALLWTQSTIKQKRYSLDSIKQKRLELEAHRAAAVAAATAAAERAARRPRTVHYRYCAVPKSVQL